MSVPTIMSLNKTLKLNCQTYTTVWEVSMACFISKMEIMGPAAVLEKRGIPPGHFGDRVRSGLEALGRKEGLM